ncbi:MAG: ribokinase, partial [Caldilineaceae bacterium]|nr:ribokinase [Caldilineaceae bacterium]
MTNPTNAPKICVVGASNIDLVSYAPRLPKIGETLPGSRFQMGFGGKGANQAVMAALLGATVTMITKVGQDIFGQDYLNHYQKLGFDTRYVAVTDAAATGVAPIWVDEGSGNNAIIVVTGANDHLAVADVEAAQAAIRSAQIVIGQWECALETTLAALRIAREAGVTTLLNPAPARAELPAEAYQLSDIFCPNESETELLTGQPVATLAEAEAAAQLFLARGARQVILTLGERGSLLVTESSTTHVPASAVQAIDTTGAGDAFCGSLAYFLAAGQSLAQATAHANVVAAASVQKRGTQTSFPRRADLPAGLFRCSPGADEDYPLT